MRLSEIKYLNEEALETRKAEDLWSEFKDKADYYVNSTQYAVRLIKDSKPAQYEAFALVNNQRKPFGKFTADKLKATLEPIRANQTPDAEGYTTYIDPEKVEAFKYSGDPIKVMLDDTNGARLSDGDYLVRSNDGNEFEYSIEKSAEFNASLTVVK